MRTASEPFVKRSLEKLLEPLAFANEDVSCFIPIENTRKPRMEACFNEDAA